MEGTPNGYSGRQWRPDSSLLEGESHFLRLLDTLPVGAYTCDPEGLITYFNPPAVRLWGRTPKLNDPADRYCGSFRLFSAGGNPLAHDRCWMALALETHREYNEREIVIERPDGERRTALAHANPIHEGRGRILGAVNVLVDITERVRVEEKLRDARYAERERMARDLHDEALQDLSYALVATQHVQRSLKGSEARNLQEQAIEALKRTGQGLRSAIYNLRLKAAHEMQFFDLLDSLIDLNRQRFPDCRIELLIRNGFPSALPEQTQTELIRILGEALANARRHSEAHSIRVTLETENGDLISEVADDGRGFHPSSRLGGVGLDGMQGRANLLGGNLEIDSELGRGTSVRVRFPRPSRS